MNESQDSNDSSTSNPNDIRQQEAEHQGAAVKAALGANIGVAIAKLAAAFFTGSSAMLSESVHSIADCSNEIVLMAGGRFSKHKTDGDHPFGLYRAKYLASFVVATLLFFVGGFFSTSEAVKKLFAIAEDPALRDANQMELLVAFIVVFISACLEATACIKASRKRTSVWSARVWPIWVCSVFGGVPSRRSLRPSLWKTRLL